MDITAEVVVVGAGPTGLLLASELALAGVDVQVVERLDEPDPTVKAGSINVATAEILDRRGLLPAARRAQQAMLALVAEFQEAHASAGSGKARPRAGGPAQFPVAGHFAGMFFDRAHVDQTDPQLAGHLAAADAVLVPQRDVEALLADRCAELGVTPRRGVQVEGMSQNDETITLQTTAGALTARWVVAADGGRSALRKLAGIGFSGTDAEITGYQAIADMDGAGALSPGWHWSPNGVYSYGPIPGRILTVQFTGPPADRSAPVTAEEVQASIRLVSGVDVTVTALHGTATRWTDNARQADSYRQGRLLVAGDAAHVHSPFSGQGLNLGAGDAVNLAWKLAATVRGWAPEGLLDTYASERMPIGAWVLDWTRAQVALMRGDEKTRQLRRVVQNQLLGNDEGMTEMVRLTSGIAQRYDVGGPDDPTGLSGRLLGDIALADGSRLADHGHDGRFVLLDRTVDHRLAATCEPWSERVNVVTDGPGEPAGLLVRPDGVVAWSTDTDDGTDDLEAALLRWAGTRSRRCLRAG